MRLNLLRLLIVAFWCGVVFDLRPQSRYQDVSFIRGKVLNSKTHQPIPYANVYFKKSRKGTSSSETGEFSLNLRGVDLADTLIFSGIGYKPHRIALHTVLNFPDQVATVFLTEDVIDLSEVTVTATPAVDIIRKAMDNRSVGYGTAPHRLRGVYRIADKEDGAFTRLAEAAVDIYDEDYMKKDSRMVDYLAVRHSKDYRTFRWQMDNLNARTAEELLKPDLIKRPNRATHPNGFERGFIYAFEGYTMLEGKEIFIISATKNPDYKWPNYNAQFYVRAEDLAIVRVDRDYHIPRPNWARGDGVKTRITRDRLILQYKGYEGKLYLDYFVWNLAGEVISEKNAEKIVKFERIEELNIEEVSFGRPGKVRSAWRDDIYEMKEPYNAAFWDSFPVSGTQLFVDVVKELGEKESLSDQFLSGQRKEPEFDTQRRIGVNELREDFSVLRSSLEEGHPALYRYTPRKRMDHCFDSVFNLLSKPMTGMEFYRLVRPIVAMIRCGHTLLKLPADHDRFIRHRDVFFPVRVEYINDTLFAAKSLNDLISKGDIIEAVNGMPVADVVASFRSSIEGDGYIQTYRNRMAATHFSQLYYRHFGGVDSFTVRVRNAAGSVSEKNLPAISPSEWEDENDPESGENTYKVIEPGVGLMRIASFIDTPARQFKDWVSKTFRNIEESNVTRLVIDIRDNEGGRDDYALYLYSFISKKPFVYQKSLSAATDNYSFLKYTNQDSTLNRLMQRITYKDMSGKFLLRDSHPTLGVHPEQEKAYGGKVFVLTNGNTFSAAADFAAIARQNKVGIFIGEETGGAAAGNTSNGEVVLTLPNTKIRLYLPLFMIVNAVDDVMPGHGVIPDHIIQNNREDVLNGYDRALAFTLALPD
jgi:C-terminal processing protease CtpA/Prc